MYSRELTDFLSLLLCEAPTDSVTIQLAECNSGAITAGSSL
jgi:hypothetical protein